MSGSTQKKAVNGKGSTRLWTIVLAVVLVLAVKINIALGVFSTLVEMYLGEGTYTIEALEGTESWGCVYNKGSYATPEEAMKSSLVEGTAKRSAAPGDQVEQYVRRKRRVTVVPSSSRGNDPKKLLRLLDLGSFVVLG